MDFSHLLKEIMKILLPIFLLFGFCMDAQTHRFIYQFQFKKDSLSQEFFKDNMILDVNPEEVKFYPYLYAENDSLNKIANEQNPMWDEQLPALVRKRNTSDHLSYMVLNDFYSLKTTDKMDWKLSDETKSEGEYKLQKASTKFGGRNWIAWFCKDIGLSEGPYKFHGLPGLIFEIEDDKKNFIFKLSKSIKYPKTYKTPFLEKFAGQKPILVTEKIIRQKKLEIYDNPVKGLSESFKDNTNSEGTFWTSNVEIKSMDQLKEIEDEIRKTIIKENNPIEIDKAIHYPKK